MKHCDGICKQHKNKVFLAVLCRTQYTCNEHELDKWEFTFVHATHVPVVVFNYTWFLYLLSTTHSCTRSTRFCDHAIIMISTKHGHISFVPPLQCEYSVIPAVSNFPFCKDAFCMTTGIPRRSFLAVPRAAKPFSTRARKSSGLE